MNVNINQKTLRKCHAFQLESKELIESIQLFYSKLRNAAQRQQRSPAFMLLFEEWGTSGRQRPTIQHLYELLISLPLFRAADYIANHILHIQRPNRPNNGPSQIIDITLPESGIESNRMIDYLDYPNTNSIEHSEFDTNHENQDKNHGNNSSYNKSIGLPRNQSTSSKLGSYSESTEITETNSETSEDNDMIKTHSSYTNQIPDDVEQCVLITEQIWVDHGQVNIPDLSLLNNLNC